MTEQRDWYVCVRLLRRYDNVTGREWIETVVKADRASDALSLAMEKVRPNMRANDSVEEISVEAYHP